MPKLSRRSCLELMQGLLAVCLLSLTLATPALAGGSDKKVGTPTYSSRNYDYYLTGSADNQAPLAPATPMSVLMGGGTDVDAAFMAMIAKARGAGNTPIDVVVIRASGADGYNDYLHQMGGVDSVETLVVKTREGANDANVQRIVAGADLLFIAGGDQWDYIKLWKGTALDQAVQGLIASKVPVGGTSAGLAVLAQFDFSAQNDTITSAQALSNPYDRRLTLDRGFITSVPGLGNTIADAHLVTRDRMGRLMTFLARIIKDAWVARPDDARGIGVDEQTAVVVDDGVGTVMGNGAAYFLRPSIAATTVQPKTPLTFASVRVDRLRAQEGTMDLRNWSRSPNVAPYWLDVIGGVLTSSGANGSIY